MTQNSPLKYALRRLKKYKIRLFVAIFWSVMFVIIPMQIPILTGALIDGINGDNSTIYGIINLEATRKQILGFSITGLILVAAAYGITAFFRTTTKAKISRNFVFDLQRELSQKIERLSMDIHSKYGSGDLLNRAILDTNSVKPFVESTIIKFVVNVFRIIYPVIILFLMEPILATIASSFLPIQFLLTQKIQKKMRRTARRVRKRRAKLTTFLKEDLDGIETVQTSNVGKHHFGKIAKQVDRVEEIELKVQKYSAMITGLAWGLTSAGLAFTWWYGGLQVLENNMTIGTLVAFTGLVVFVYAPVRRFADIMRVYNKSIVSMERIQEILDLPSSVNESPDSKPLLVSDGNIKFNNVSFAYQELPVLSEITVNLKSKNLITVIGKSDSGKSSFLRLISRLYDPNEGEIYIDEQNIKNVTLDSLRSQIAVVPQEPMIFSGTIYDNITLRNPNATMGEVEKACKTADALDFILDLENDFQTVLGQGGTTLSKGQEQRITIARALLRRPKILLLDEPSAALDINSESILISNLNKIKTQMTILLITHNLEMAKHVDQIILMDKGKIQKVDSYDQLQHLQANDFLRINQEKNESKSK